MKYVLLAKNKGSGDYNFMAWLCDFIKKNTLIDADNHVEYLIVKKAPFFRDGERVSFDCIQRNIKKVGNDFDGYTWFVKLDFFKFIIRMADGNGAFEESIRGSKNFDSFIFEL